ATFIRSFLFLSAVALFFSLSSNQLYAQATSTSTITGQATDPTGAAVPGVNVTLTNPETSTQLTTTTNTDGRYVFTNVSVGTYNITFAKQGFAKSRVEQQKVEVGTTLTVNTAMEVGSTSTTVEVQAQAAAELQTTSASVGTTVTSKDLQDLPNLARDSATLAVLQPGITPGGSTAGAVQDQNTYTVDGGNNSDDMAGNSTSYVTNFTGLGGAQTGGSSAGAVPVPVESIEEFKVTTFQQTADFNGGLGSQVQMVTKRGTNQFHGSGYEYYFATNVGAGNSWANDHTCTPFSTQCQSVTTPSGTGTFPTQGYANPLPSNHRNRFGASLGGYATPNVLGGKWYFFFNYEGQRFPNNNVYERSVPSDLMKLGVIQVPIGANNTYTAFNLNPYPVTYQGTTYPACSGAYCDPRSIGINPVVKQIWAQMPTGNDSQYGGTGADQHNVIGYLGSLKTPLTDDIYVGRVDHDFGDKWHFFSSYRFMRLVNLTSNQVDIGGVLPGDVKGTPAAVAPRDQLPSLLVGGLTTVISATMTNDFRYSYTRNFWQWGSVNAPPQLAGLGGAVEIAPGSSSTNAESTSALIPYNVNTQNVRQRFWDGHDHMLKDDVSKIKGNHIIQFGGLYQRNYDFHMRTDNGNGVNNAIVYQVGSGGVSFSGFGYPAGLSSSNQTIFQRLYGETLGLVTQPQVAYTRTGSNLTIQPVGSVAYERSIIPTYSLYAADTWHMTPTFTLTYGMSWEAQLPPYELNGSQVLPVDANGKVVSANQYISARESAALAGQVYNPVVGFETIRGTGRKYPYNPVWDQFSPRVAIAWNPKFSSGLLGSVFGDGKTVMRGGYGRIYGRLNGVDLVLVPLLGPGLLQAVSCPNPNIQGVCNSSVTPSTAFRIGTDGLSAPLPAPTQTLAQPFFPGLNGNPAAQDPSVLDPNYRPERTDNFTFSVQRAIGNKMTFETGYIGRIIRNETQNVNIDAVPYMTQLGGQSFASAYANIYLSLCGAAYCAATPSSATVSAVPVQPFLEAALGGANSTYCKGSASCTAKFVSANLANWTSTSVSTIWRNLNANWTLPQSMMDVSQQITSLVYIASGGYGNYNALYGTYRVRDFHGFSSTSNFTWGRALGTGAVTQASSSYTQLDSYNIGANYGANGFDIKFLFNSAVSWESPWYKTQKGFLGHVLGGWVLSSILTAQSASGESVTYNESGLCGGGCQAFGESSSSSITSNTENAVAAAPYTGGTSAHYNVAGSGGIGTNNPAGVNQFSNPAQVYSEFRPCILGYDTSCGGYYNIRGLPSWNVDAGALKDFGIWKEGRVGATLSFQITNVFNHVVMNNPSYISSSNLSLSSQNTFGRITGAANIPRNMEFGLRIHF
ncbi:MAG TPA: carboxypeptidase-like regulatory domain-containing protein, partial [Bryobacteraceae bacterium]|nr:carboxypeptidase-like regulatory domain-containing protein [Bryobacteraceae bacterium]